jgi:hypothetical protein
MRQQTLYVSKEVFLSACSLVIHKIQKMSVSSISSPCNGRWRHTKNKHKRKINHPREMKNVRINLDSQIDWTEKFPGDY